MKDYGSKYSEEKFWDKLKRYASKAGIKVVYNALLLFYTLQKKEVPAWVRIVIVGALGYFIFPLDGIPDPTPIVGYSDDLGALLSALAAVAAHVDEPVKEKARKKLKVWFGKETVEKSLSGNKEDFDEN